MAECEDSDCEMLKWLHDFKWITDEHMEELPDLIKQKIANVPYQDRKRLEAIFGCLPSAGINIISSADDDDNLYFNFFVPPDIMVENFYI